MTSGGIEYLRRIKGRTRFPLAYGTSATAEGRSCSSISAPLGLTKKRFRTQSKGRGRDGASWVSWCMGRNKDKTWLRRMLRRFWPDD